MNDVYQLEPMNGRGGLARVATLVRGLRAQTPQTLFVLAGDTLSPSILSTIFQGRQMVEVWNAIGLDAAVFGNHEFDFGPALLRIRREVAPIGVFVAQVMRRRMAADVALLNAEPSVSTVSFLPGL